MRETTFALSASGNVQLHGLRWSPEDISRPRASIQVIHGMAEHASRYRPLAEALTARGYEVFAIDLRGHGKTAQSEADLGFFADHDGWDVVQGDLLAMHEHIERQCPGVPRLMIAHSMGSMLARDYITRHGHTLKGVVLSGTSAPAGLLGKIGVLAAKAERFRVGARGHSRLLEGMSTEDYNRAFRPNRTTGDWLSRDEAQVDMYIADPLCGFDFTVQGWIDVLEGVQRIEDRARMRTIPAELPLLLASGGKDPLGKNGKGIEKLATMLRQAGVKQVDVKLYPDARHEIFNEVNRAEVFADTIAWLDARVA